jgi:tRNA-uridine 2-sulfurtransferase
MDFPLPIPPALRQAAPPGTRVLLALSGGVDSAVALAMLRHLGCDITAVTFRNFCLGDAGPEGVDGERSCCSLEAAQDARRVAASLGARHWVHDVAPLFRDEVIAPFVAEYAAGRTPNPCLACNARVRFPELVRLADQFGLDLVATGHYARREGGRGQARLRRGVDREKDQSYFLYRLGRSLLARALFPLGWVTKAQVRDAARVLGLPVATKAESQEICFVPDDDRTSLFAGGAAAAAGEIVDREGRVVGAHRGLAHYTVGQRRGLGVAAAQPLYVLALDAPRNRVVVGPEEALVVREVVCDDVVETSGPLPETGPPADRACVARIRHRHAGVRVAGWRRSDGRLEVALAEPARGVAPGQALVLYEDDLVLGGGRIVGTA